MSPTDLAPLAITVPLIAGFLLVLVGRYAPRPVVDAIAALATVAVVLLNAVLLHDTTRHDVVTWAADWHPEHGFSVGIVLTADEVGAGLALLSSVLVLCALVFTWRYFEDVEAHFAGLVMLFLAGMCGFALTGDLFDLLVFFELMGAAAYALAGYKVEDESAMHGAFNFGVVNSLAAYLSLMGVGILYAQTGNLSMAAIGQALQGHSPDALVVTAYALVVCGFLTKGSIVPFHFWLDDAHAVAPTPICVLFSGVMVELGVYALLRVTLVVFGGTLPLHVVSTALFCLGVGTAVVGAVMCFAQRHVKRLLAYSTIAHVGLFLCAASMFKGDGVAGAALYVVSHAGAKGALFLLTGVLLDRYGTVDEIWLYGKAVRARGTGLLYLLGGLALAGLPPFGTGLGKALSEDALSKDGRAWATALFVGVSAVTAGAVLRVALRVFWGVGPVPMELHGTVETVGEEQPETPPLGHTPLTMSGPAAALLVGCFVLGVWPHLASHVGRAGERFTDRAGYLAATLHGASTVVHAPAGMAWTAPGIWYGVLSGVLAVVAAAVGIWSSLAPQAIQAAGRVLGAPLVVLRRLHSGHVGDYVAWQFAGLAVVAALVGLPVLR